MKISGFSPLDCLVIIDKQFNDAENTGVLKFIYQVDVRSLAV